MPRGRHYYDPIIQTGAVVEGESDLSRIEFYLDDDQKWRGRRIAPDGLVTDVAPGDFSHDGALRQAQALWPGLTVYELQSPQDDSTWEGHGPSPRVWKGPSLPTEALPASTPEPQEEQMSESLAEVSPEGAQTRLNGIRVSDPGLYVRIEDMVLLLEEWAQQYELDRNPSGALALREAADSLREATR